MTRIDLVTGFLGAGKTAFLAGYADWLRRRGARFAAEQSYFTKVLKKNDRGHPRPVPRRARAARNRFLYICLRMRASAPFSRRETCAWEI